MIKDPINSLEEWGTLNIGDRIYSIYSTEYQISDKKSEYDTIRYESHMIDYKGIILTDLTLLSYAENYWFRIRTDPPISRFNRIEI